MYSMEIPDEIVLPLRTPAKKAPETDHKNNQNDEKNSLNFSSDSEIDQTEQNIQQPNSETEKKSQCNIEKSQTKNVQTDQKNNKKQKKSKKQKKHKKKSMSTSNKQQKKQKFYCRFYMQGSCKNSTNCKFIHPVNIPTNHIEGKKQKQAKHDVNGNDKPQQFKGEKMEEQTTFKSFKDFYFERMIDSMKVNCFSCKEKDIPVTLSCGCCTICEKCAKAKKPCCKENHIYDNKVYIK